MKARGQAKPGRQVCPLCALDDDDLISWEVDAPGLWRFRCTNHNPPYEWVTAGTGAIDDSGRDGITEELGVYEDMLALFTEPGPYLEWGIVEHRYALRRPDAYRELVDRYSHTAFGPTQYSASAFLGRAAGDLARRGELALKFVRATGYWSYNGTIAACALPPGPAGDEVTTWAEFATSLGFDPEDWPALGYRASEGPRPRLVVDDPWTTALGRRWFDDSHLSAEGLCAWNHTREDPAPATRLVVTEHGGVQDARGCCDACYASVLRYVGRSE